MRRLRAPRQQSADGRLVAVVAGIAAAAPEWTPGRIAAQLETMRERTLRGGTRWHAAQVRTLLLRSEGRGLVPRHAAHV